VIQGTDKERLLTCIEALNQTNEVDHFSYGNGESRFEQNLNHVMTFLNAAITTQGEHGGHPGDPTALYICGVPGIGKTSGVKWCCNKMIQEVEKRTIRVEGNWTPLLCEVNATRLQNVQNPLKELIESMSKALGLSKISMSNVERKLKQGGLLILVVDEIDTLVSSASKRGNSGKLSGRERVVQKLLEWTSDDNMGLAVIGISNSTGNDKFCRLQELGKVCSVDCRCVDLVCTKGFPLTLTVFPHSSSVQGDTHVQCIWSTGYYRYFGGANWSICHG
jgi:ATPase family associated with various cellular activities (AAA)